MPYYYNTVTKASVWVMPRELAAALVEVDAEEAAAPRSIGAQMVRDRIKAAFHTSGQCFVVAGGRLVAFRACL